MCVYVTDRFEMLQHVYMLANMIQKERRMMQGRQKVAAEAKSLNGWGDAAEMKNAAERERTVKGKKEVKCSVQWRKQKRKWLPNAGGICGRKFRERQHCCLFSLVTLCCSGLREHKVCKELCFISAEVLPYLQWRKQETRDGNLTSQNSTEH